MKKLTAKEIKILESMMKDRRGKKLIERFIWTNTTEAKFKVGQKVLVTDRGHRVYGVEIIDFIGTIKDVKFYSAEHRITYEVDINVSKEDGSIYTLVCYASEYELKATRKRNTINNITSKEKYAESMDVSLPF